MDKRVSFFIFMLLLITMAWISQIAYLISHENIHQIILKRYDIDSKIEIDIFKFSGKAIPDEEAYKTNCNDHCKFQNALNDIIGYNFAVFLLVFWLAFIIWFLYDLVRKQYMEVEVIDDGEEE